MTSTAAEIAKNAKFIPALPPAPVFGVPGTVVVTGDVPVVPVLVVVVFGAIISTVPEIGSAVPLLIEVVGVIAEPLEVLLAMMALGSTEIMTLEPVGVADETLQVSSNNSPAPAGTENGVSSVKFETPPLV
jgi:hypothetical protein